MLFLLVAEELANTSCKSPYTPSHTQQFVEHAAGYHDGVGRFCIWRRRSTTLYNNCRFMCFYFPYWVITTIDIHEFPGTMRTRKHLGRSHLEYSIHCSVTTPALERHRSQLFRNFRIYTSTFSTKASAGMIYCTKRASGYIRNPLQMCCLALYEGTYISSF